MKKIMFNDKYSLTESVLSGKKTMTRRIITPEPTNIRHWAERFRKCSNCFYRDERGLCELHSEEKLLLPKYKVGEVVAVAQSYKDCGEFDVYEAPKDTVGWKNKMLVRADLMPHQIHILGVRAERLQDITEEDCLREYPECDTIIERHINKALSMGASVVDNWMTRRDVFAWLIDKISGKGTWERNPFVWVYEFELIKNQ